MNDDEIRALVRSAIQKHLSPSASPEAGERTLAVAAVGREGGAAISFSQYALQPPGGDPMCLIEPAVRCNHCGYCKCHGH